MINGDFTQIGRRRQQEKQSFIARKARPFQAQAMHRIVIADLLAANPLHPTQRTGFHLQRPGKMAIGQIQQRTNDRLQAEKRWEKKKRGAH